MKKLNNNEIESVTIEVQKVLLEHNNNIRKKNKIFLEEVYKAFKEDVEKILEGVNIDINNYVKRLYKSNTNFKKYLNPIKENYNYVDSYFPNITSIVYKGIVPSDYHFIRNRVILDNTKDNKNITIEEFIQSIIDKIIDEYTN